MCKVDAAERITSTAPIHPFIATPWHTAHSLLRASQLMVCQQKGFCSCVVLLKSPAVPLADLLPQGPSGNLSHQMPAWRLEKRSRIITEKLILPRKRKGVFSVQFLWVSVTGWTQTGYKILNCWSMGSLIYFLLINHQCENRLMSQTMLTRASSEVVEEPAETLMISDNFWSVFKPLWIKALK